jgi:type III secretion protein C
MSWTVVVSKRSIGSVVAICSIVATEMTPNVAGAASSDWRDAPYHYVVLNQSVADVLVNFGFNTGLRMSIAPEVTGIERGRIDAATAGSFLDALTKANDLDWYFDGSVMYVSPRSAEQTVAVPLHGVSFAVVKASLTQSEFWDDRYGLAWNGLAGFVTVSGPPSYVALIKQAIEAETLVSKPTSEAEASGSKPNTEAETLVAKEAVGADVPAARPTIEVGTSVTEPPDKVGGSVTKQAVGAGVPVTKLAVEAETAKESYLVIYRGAQSTSVKFP